MSHYNGHELTILDDGPKGTKIAVCRCAWVTAPSHIDAALTAIKHHVRRAAASARAASQGPSSAA
jgi:hypothetical protein